MRIILIEDNHFKVDNIKYSLNEHFENVELDVYETEFEFVDQIDLIAANPPDIFIIDLMLIWDVSSKNIKDPNDYIDNYTTLFEAGFRCKELIRTKSNLSNSPISILTVLEEKGLGEKANYLGRNTKFLEYSPKPYKLIKLIKQMLEDGKK